MRFKKILSTKFVKVKFLVQVMSYMERGVNRG